MFVHMRFGVPFPVFVPCDREDEWLVVPGA